MTKKERRRRSLALKIARMHGRSMHAPSVDVLSRALGASPKRIRRATQLATEKGYLYPSRSGTPDGRRARDEIRRVAVLEAQTLEIVRTWPGLQVHGISERLDRSVGTTAKVLRRLKTEGRVVVRGGYYLAEDVV